MTCEVLVANRLGIVLAADSAITFTSTDGTREERSFSTGANKIFQLSDYEPVGAMIFNNSALQGIPWELIIKSFRKHLGSAQHASINSYADALKDFIKTNKSLFPDNHREHHTKELIATTLKFLFDFAERNYSDIHNADAEKAKVAGEELKTLLSGVQSGPLPQHFTTSDVTQTLTEYGDWLEQLINDILGVAPKHATLVALLSPKGLVSIVIEMLYKLYPLIVNGNYTGIVIAGYGEEDCFPSYKEVRYVGFINSALIIEDGKNADIDHNELDSIIEAFAQQSMVETFVKGYSPAVWERVGSESDELINTITQDLINAGATLPGDWPTKVKEYQKAFSDNWTKAVLTDHYLPLRRVIAGLAIEEMTELAETLVMLESLKEKVTSRTQSVGGPIDVAVITKSEGLVWLKRKLYFDPALNQRYFLRQQKRH